MSNTRATRPPRAKPAAKKQEEPEGPFLELFGDTYKVATQVGIWPLMQFARAAETGTALTDHRGLAACHAFLEQVVDPEDWARFQNDMITKRVNDLDALLTAARQAVDALYKRQQEQNGTGNARGRAAANGRTPLPGAGARELPAADPRRFRAADADRKKTMDRLDAALHAGRLDTDEHAARLETAQQAKTLGELDALTEDLPDDESTGD
jgi:Domain of unknown function (DUF1707)